MAGLSALSFTTPWLLTALALLPVIWLLMRATPPKPSSVRFPAFVILRRLKTTEETPDKTPWWLLLLRLCLAGLIIVALAGPILNAPKPTPGAGPLVLVIDNSWAAAPGWRARIDAMRLAIAEAETAQRPVIILPTTPSLIPDPIKPLTAGEARDVVSALAPAPFLPDYAVTIEQMTALDNALEKLIGSVEIRWMSDGLAGDKDTDLAQSLAERGTLTVFAGDDAPQLILKAAQNRADSDAFTIERVVADNDWSGEIIAIARDGRELGRQIASLPTGTAAADISFDLPLALKNDISSVRIENSPSASTIHLSDARDRRALIGLTIGDSGQTNNLLTGIYYVQKALEPFAAFQTDSLENLLVSDVSVIVLDDVGRLRSGDAEALTDWIKSGGIVIRFAGPNLADAAQNEDPVLLPAPLRGGRRAFGGALSWETPQKLGAFSADGPFADFTVPDDVLIRRQVLAAPGGATSAATWVSLADGTPLVTGTRDGDGALVLFHVTATPAWSDLPISAVFIEMLRKLTFLSVLSPEQAETETTIRFPAHRVLDGFGRFEQPASTINAVTEAQANAGANPAQPPGFYGTPDAALAINTVSAEQTFKPLSLPGVLVKPYLSAPPTNLAPPLLVIALLLLLADALATLVLSGRLPRLGSTASLLFFASIIITPTDKVAAQPLDTPIDEKAFAAAIAPRLAYIETGDPQLDLLSERGLSALSQELFRRTAIEPAPPVGLDPETDDLSVYPFLYWPIAPGTVTPSEAALANIENFMRFGGLVVFDTRDDERAVAGLETPERVALRSILSQLDVPPLMPLPSDHVLTRSYYLLTELPGRMWNNPIWVQAVGGANDAVTPLVISGRDWAGAWAVDEFGRPMLPVGRAGARVLRCAPHNNAPIRECALRAGINMVMVAFTGNYKSDQVHTPALLERLGRE